jgi:hypothetical protein
MYRTILVAAALLCATVNAEARQRHAVQPICDNRDVMRPCAYQPNFLAGVRSISISLKRDQATPAARPARRSAKAAPRAVSRYGAPEPSLTWTATALVDRAKTYLGGRPANCPARAWCGCWLASHMGISDRSLWLASNWARVGHSAGGPQVGAIVVWRHHVGKIKAVDGGRILVLSGNDGRAVRERWRTTAGVVAYRVTG